MAESKGFFRRTPVHLRVASLLDHVGKNSPPDCFLPQTTSAPSLFESLFIYFANAKSRRWNLRSFHFCWDSSLDFCAALEFECHPSVRPGGIFYGFAKLFNFSVPLPSNKRNCRQKRTQRNGQSIQHEQKRHQIWISAVKPRDSAVCNKIVKRRRFRGWKFDNGIAYARRERR